MTSAEDRVFERQRLVRFEDLDELFFARLLLARVEDPKGEPPRTVEFNLGHVFPQFGTPAEAEAAARVDFDYSDRMTEEFVDALGASLPAGAQAKTTRREALEYYTDVIRTRLEFLRDGDSVGLPSSIDRFEEPVPGRFAATFSPRKLRSFLQQHLRTRLSLRSDFVNKIQKRLPGGNMSPRVDYRKLLDLLQAFLDARQAHTGEQEFSLTSAEIPFRHSISVFSDGAAMPALGSCGPAERVLLPLYLELCGLLDIQELWLSSSPVSPFDLETRYLIRRPCHHNIYDTASRGLSAEVRQQLSEIQLSIYDRVHADLQKRYVFLGRPNLEASFAELAAWLIRKVTFTLEEPAFLGKPASRWLKANADRAYSQIEDQFFLPFLYERLTDVFPRRVSKKPDRFGGEVDLLFDNIPLELKVRKGVPKALSECIDQPPISLPVRRPHMRPRLGLV